MNNHQKIDLTTEEEQSNKDILGKRNDDEFKSELDISEQSTDYLHFKKNSCFNYFKMTSSNNNHNIGKCIMTIKDLNQVSSCVFQQPNNNNNSNNLVSNKSEDFSQIGPLNQLQHFNILFTKLLFSEMITQDDINKLSQLESDLLKDFIKFKNWNKKNFFKLDSKFFSSNIITFEKPLSISHKLNYILNQLFTYLIHVFQSTIFNNISSFLLPKYKRLNKSTQLKYAFYGYYFGQISHKSSIKIENFFYTEEKYQNNKNEAPIIAYINLIKKSRLFYDDVVYFFDNLFINTQKDHLFKQAKLMCCNWENQLGENNQKVFLQKLKMSDYDISENQSFWTIHESNDASKEFLNLFK